MYGVRAFASICDNSRAVEAAEVEYERDSSGGGSPVSDTPSPIVNVVMDPSEPTRVDVVIAVDKVSTQLEWFGDAGGELAGYMDFVKQSSEVYACGNDCTDGPFTSANCRHGLHVKPSKTSSPPHHCHLLSPVSQTTHFLSSPTHLLLVRSHAGGRRIGRPRRFTGHFPEWST